MVQHIDEDHRIEAVVVVRNPLAVESLDRNQRLLAQVDFDAAQLDVGPHLGDLAADASVAAAHVEDPGALRQQLADVPRQHTGSPIDHEGRVQIANRVHEKVCLTCAPCRGC